MAFDKTRVCNNGLGHANVVDVYMWFIIEAIMWTLKALKMSIWRGKIVYIVNQ